MALRPLTPEASASASFATSAFFIISDLNNQKSGPLICLLGVQSFEHESKQRRN